MANQEDFLTTEELSDRWRGKISVKTLANWRTSKIGPKFFYPSGKKGGAVLYYLSSVVAIESEECSHTGEYTAF